MMIGSTYSRGSGASRVQYLLGTAFLGVLYFYFFWMGMHDAPDRFNYIIFFDSPLTSRFEPGFVVLGQALQGVGIPSEASVYLLAACIFLFAAGAVWNLFQGESGPALLTFFLLFFSVFSVFSYAQLRMGLATWSALYMFSLFLRTSKRRYLGAALLAGTLHFGILPFVLTLVLHRVLRIKIRYVFGAAMIAMGVIAIILEDLLAISQFAYYDHYFAGAPFRLFGSALLFFYALILLAGVFLRRQFDSSKYAESVLSLVFVFTAAAFASDIFVKFGMPFILLHMISIANAAALRLNQPLERRLIYVVALLAFPFVALYGIWKF